MEAEARALLAAAVLTPTAEADVSARRAQLTALRARAREALHQSDLSVDTFIAEKRAQADIDETRLLQLISTGTSNNQRDNG